MPFIPHILTVSPSISLSACHGFPHSPSVGYKAAQIYALAVCIRRCFYCVLDMNNPLIFYAHNGQLQQEQEHQQLEQREIEIELQ